MEEEKNVVSISRYWWKRASWASLSVEEKTVIAKARLLEPAKNISKLAEELNVTPACVKKIEKQLSFDEDHAVAWLMSSILAKDNELLELAWEANIKFAKQVAGQRTLKAKDVDTLDKLTNSALKRAALVAAANNEDSENTEMNITLTF